MMDGCTDIGAGHDLWGAQMPFGIFDIEKAGIASRDCFSCIDLRRPGHTWRKGAYFSQTMVHHKLWHGCYRDRAFC